MEYYIDYDSISLNKYGEELCGDTTLFQNEEDRFIAILSDGLGSGVKANILSTLTATISMTMLKEGLSLHETISTLINTLPVCKEREIAYSTFSIIKILNENKAYIAEFDSPKYFFIRRNHIEKVSRREQIIEEKRIFESEITLQEGDVIVFISDGVLEASSGMILNTNWEWQDVADFLTELDTNDMSAKEIATSLCNVCEALYEGRPGDDMTVSAIKLVKASTVNMLIGAPLDKKDDKNVVQKLVGTLGKKVVCGGTSASIVARELDTEVITDIASITEGVPPIGFIDGIDLVTEGVITLGKVNEVLRKLSQNISIEEENNLLNREDAVAMLTKILYRDSSNINVIFGKAVNAVHRDMNFADLIESKEKIVCEMVDLLRKLGKIVTIEYV